MSKTARGPSTYNGSRRRRRWLGHSPTADMWLGTIPASLIVDTLALIIVDVVGWVLMVVGGGWDTDTSARLFVGHGGMIQRKSRVNVWLAWIVYMFVVRKVDGDSTGPHSQQVSVCSLNVCFFSVAVGRICGKAHDRSFCHVWITVQRLSSKKLH